MIDEIEEYNKRRAYNQALNVARAEDAATKSNAPSHYAWFKEKFGIESRKIVEQFTFNIGSAMKYLIRHGRKKSMSMNEREKTIDDLKKAIDFINFEIERLSCQPLQQQ